MSPAGVQIALQERRGGQWIDVGLAVAEAAAQLADGAQCPSGGHPLVFKGDGKTCLLGDAAADPSSRARPLVLHTFRGERKADEEPTGLMFLEVRAQRSERETPSCTAMQGAERMGEALVGVGEREPDPLLTDIEGEDATGTWESDGCERGLVTGSAGRSSAPPVRHPSCIVAKNSLFVFVRFIRSSRNSVASTVGMSARKFRNR